MTHNKTSNISNRNSRVAKNTIFLTVRMIFILIVSLYTTRIILKSLGVIDFGIYNVVCGFVSMFAFLNTSMTNGIQRFYNFELGKETKPNINMIFNAAVFIQLGLALLLIIFCETIGLWYMENKMVVPEGRIQAANIIFQLSLLSFLFIILQSPFSALVMAYEKMGFYSIVSVIDAILKLIIAFILPLFDADHLIIYGILFSCISIINFLVFYTYDKIKFPGNIKFALSFNKKTFLSMLSFSGWNIFGSFSGMMKEHGINLVLNFFYGPVVNAARGVANQVNGGIQSLVANLSVAVRPQVIQSYASGNIERTMRLTYSISKIGISVLYLFALPIVFESHYILNIWLGTSIPAHTETFIQIVIIISFISTLNSAVSGVVHASGKMKVYQTVTSFVSLLCVPVAYIALKQNMIPEVALWSIFLFSFLSHICSLIILKSIVRFSMFEYVRKIIFPFITLVILTFGVVYIPHCMLKEGIFRLITVTIIAITVITPAIYIFVLDLNEKNTLKKIIFKRKS